MFLWNFFERSGPKGASGVKKIFQKKLILASEVVVQLPQYTLMEKKSETKIKKITHSETGILSTDYSWESSKNKEKEFSSQIFSALYPSIF